MSRIAYVDGRFLPLAEAGVPVEDRGLQFADSVYEVWALRGGVLFDHAGHLERLGRSLGALRIDWPVSPKALDIVIRELVRRNRVRDGLVYLQITRGTAPRDHPFPKDTKATLILTVRRKDPAAADARAARGLKVKTFPDIRWGRVDIKTTGLLPNLLARQDAIEAGADDAWLVDGDGLVTEGTAQNAWIVDAAGTLRTRPLGHDILGGITRATVLQLVGDLGLGFEERPFNLAEAAAAREAFVTSATSYVTPVISIDGKPVADGKPGPVAAALRRAYLAANATPRQTG
jgi:D-alanine transaminase